MMKKAIYMTVMLAMISLVGFSIEATAQYRVNQRSAKNTIKQIENGADKFKKSLERGLDRSRLDDTRAEDRINDFVSEFEQATNQLRSDYKDDNRGSGAVREVLRRGKTIDDYMSRLRGNSNSKRQWNSLRGDLDQLARLYSVSWKWGR